MHASMMFDRMMLDGEWARALDAFRGRQQGPPPARTPARVSVVPVAAPTAGRTDGLRAARRGRPAPTRDQILARTPARPATSAHAGSTSRAPAPMTPAQLAARSAEIRARHAGHMAGAAAGARTREQAVRARHAHHERARDAAVLRNGGELRVRV